MSYTPICKKLVNDSINELGISNIGNATIRELVALVNRIESKGTEAFIRMEMGVPGLKASSIGVDAEIEALNKGVASAYPLIDGIAPLKAECARFAKQFLNINIKAEGCIPTVGSMQGTYAAFMAVTATSKERNTILFIDPGFPVQKQQLEVMGSKYKSFDLYNFRGSKLKAKLEEYIALGNICAIAYSNPNNPSWTCLSEEELSIIGELANKHELIVLEDLAYFAMDFRSDLSKPGVAPYQASIAKYCSNYMLFISSSKIFSYAGQRIGMLLISDALYHKKYVPLAERFKSDSLGHTIVHRILYSISSGTSHSAQWAMAAMLKEANDGTFNFVEELKVYEEKAKVAKRIFIENGFHLVYPKDGESNIGDGFYFTIGYKQMEGGELLKQLLYYGISAINLKGTGSEKEGLRACISLMKPSQFEQLSERLKLFNKDFSG